MRLIDADALMARFQREQNTMYEHGREYSFSFLNSGQEISTEWYAVEQFLEEAPTIDAVAVVAKPEQSTLSGRVTMLSGEGSALCADSGS